LEMLEYPVKDLLIVADNINSAKCNTVALSDAVYDQISAKAVYDALSGFMRHAATGLKE
jgi:hypothetical protein